MKICIPVNEDNGLSSTVCAHFGSAPLFIVVDTDTSECESIENKNRHHAHGMCTPLASLQGVTLDGVAVGGIGAGALNKLRAGGIQVFLSEFATVKETADAAKSGTLKPLQPSMVCAGHGHGQGQGQGQGRGRQGGCGH